MGLLRPGRLTERIERRNKKMNVSYKMMGVVLCGAMLLASGCGAKAETTASSAVESESVSVVALEAASSEAVPESEAVSEAVSEASSAVSEAAESKAESKAETAAKSKPAKQETAASSKEEKTEPVESKPVTETAPAETASLETALKYVGKDVSKLYAAIGKPNSSEYASSCIGDGEDGLLYYNGFTVTTYRENGKETVQDAY